jgi:triosephosphate isomerase
MCGHIRSVIAGLYGEEVAENVIIQYGGSVKPDNISELMDMYEIDGALVGGASLKPDKFIEIVNF